MVRATSALALALIVAVVAIAVALSVYFAFSRPMHYPQHRIATGIPTISTTTSSTAATIITSTTVTSTTPGLPTLAQIESSLNLSAVASLGPANTSKVIVIAYDPECPYCAIELNATLPFLYYVSVNTSQARVVFLGVPIHEYSYPMLEILQAVYHRYGQNAFAMLLDANYAYYVYLIELYESGVLKSFQMPNVTTLLYMAYHLGYNVTQQQIEAQNATVYSMYMFTVTHGITGTPTILAYNSTGAPVYVQVGLINPQYIVGNLTKDLNLRLPSR